MGFCDLSGDSVEFVTGTYLIALLPWSIISLWDPINRKWTPYWIVFCKSWIYLVVSILPYFVLIPYAVVQGCSEDDDIKELLAAIVAMFASVWNLRRAVRGVLALREVCRVWNQVDIQEVSRCFADWISDVVGPHEPFPSHEQNVKLLPKLDVVDVLVSHSVVDNDWSGEAPRTAYIWKPSRSPEGFDRLNVLPPVLADDSERLEKQCILSLWCLWMAHARDERYKDSLYFGTGTKVTGTESEDNLLPTVKWIKQFVKRIVQHSGTCSEDLRSKWNCPSCSDSCNTEMTNICAWCTLRPLVTRAFSISQSSSNDEYSRVFEYELRIQASKLPAKVQAQIKLSGESRIKDLYTHHTALAKKCRKLVGKDSQLTWCPALRMGLVLGLENHCEDSLKDWLKTPCSSRSSSETTGEGTPESGEAKHQHFLSHEDMKRKFLSFALLVAVRGLPVKTDHTWISTIEMDKKVHSLSREKLYRLGRIVRTIKVLLFTGANIQPLGFLQRRRQERWNALFSSVLGEDWGEASNRSAWNKAVKEELLLLSHKLAEEALPHNSGQFKLLPSCIAYKFHSIETKKKTFQDLRKETSKPEESQRRFPAFYGEDHRVQLAKLLPKMISFAAKDIILSNEERWEIHKNRTVTWIGGNEGWCKDIVSLQADFDNVRVGGSLKAGIMFRFPCWKGTLWPISEEYGDIDFIIEGYEMESTSSQQQATQSLVFQTEALNLFHYVHHEDAQLYPATRHREWTFPLATLHVLYDDMFSWLIEGLRTGDHSNWRVLECSGIPTSSFSPNHSNYVRLSLRSRGRTSEVPADLQIEIDSVWIAEETDNQSPEDKSWRVLSAIQRVERPCNTQFDEEESVSDNVAIDIEES